MMGFLSRLISYRFRKKNPTHRELTVEFLKESAKMAAKGKAQVLLGSFPVLNKVLNDQDNEVFLLVFKGERIKKESLQDWFRNYK